MYESVTSIKATVTAVSFQAPAFAEVWAQPSHSTTDHQRDNKLYLLSKSEVNLKQVASHKGEDEGEDEGEDSGRLWSSPGSSGRRWSLAVALVVIIWRGGLPSRTSRDVT